jgi:hypothetical protein
MQLLRELQHALYEIARQAELGNEGSLAKVQLRAEQSLRLVDSCMISSQVEMGQIQLNLSPYGVGSIMHEAAHDLRLLTGNGVLVHAGVNQPVMTNAELLKNLLYSAGNFIFDAVKAPVFLRSFPTKNGSVGVGVFAKNFSISPKDLRNALDNSSSAYMPMAQHSQRSGVMLLLADTLAQTLGSELEVKRMGSYRGFAATLPPSRQLSLVEG